MIGIVVTTGALVVLLSAFNGIESMVAKLYNDFDSDIRILPSEGKTFFESEIDTLAIRSIDGIENTLMAVEEVVVLKHEKQWANAKLLGVEEGFLQMANLNSSEHLIDGHGALNRNGKAVLIGGASLMDRLEAFIPEYGIEMLTVYAPKRNIKIRMGKSPFKIDQLQLVARINYNREVNAEYVVTDIKKARQLLGYQDECSSLLVDISEDADLDRIKEELEGRLGTKFKVQTRYEKNELIFKTSQSEKVIVIIILLFKY